ncbi:MAG: DoxX family protein [Bacteroidales bacterium]|nr:DoxX family protein [Bacteroidales bacterium]
MKTLITISRIITGVVFAFSGFVKSVDPIGTQIKFEDYFGAMGLDFLMPVALTFSILLNAAELVIGLMLIFNLFPKLTSWTALLFLIIFTPLTFWLAIANPVTDCGCFGDAIKLTNWQTFWKNVVLLAFVLLFFINRKKVTSKYSIKKASINTVIFLIAVFSFQFHNLVNLPLIDFRPFKIGVNIKEASSTPEDAEKDVYETALFYKNLQTGESKEFSIDNIPYEDTLTWEYDTTITKLISKGYEPSIHDFFLNNLSGRDLTEQILNNTETSFILILHNFEKGIKKLDNKIKDISYFAKQNNINFYCFTSSESSEIQIYKERLPKYIKICTGDYKMLKTFIRANPGFVVLKDAVIIDKQHYKNIDLNDFKK